MRNLFLAVCFLLFSSFAAHAQQLGIVTGGPTGTYIKIGEDLKTIVKPSGFDLTVYESAGSIQNVFDVRQRRGVQLGIVQSDVLEYIRDISDDQELKSIASKLRLVFPLYNEEVHLLADFSIKGIDDLNGKRVAIGPERSGTYLTAKTIFHFLGIKPADEVFLGGQEALTALRANRIDAMFYVAGAPATLFSDNTTADDKFHLIGLDDKALEGYVPVTIPAGTYSWQESAVETVAVKAVLMSFNYRGTHCGHVGKIAKIIRENKSWLDSNGHPKWRQVDLTGQLPKWPQYDCVSDRIEESGKPDIVIVR